MGLAKEVVTTQTHEKLCSDILFSHESVRFVGVVNNKSDLLYRRGGSYERLGDYQKADEDLKYSLKINPDDAYVLNYLAYSWLERDYKI